MPNVASFDNEPKPKKKKEKKKSKGKNSPAATPADDNDELTESDDPPPLPKPPRHRKNAKLTAGDRDQIAELVAQKMNPSANSESGRLLSVDQLIQLGVVQRVQTPKQNLLETLLKHSSNTTDPVALLQAVEKTSLFNN